MKLLAAFVAGLLAGVATSCLYILSLKATLKLYMSYIHERIDKWWDEPKTDQAGAPRHRVG
jgi:hypothetical protein